MDRRGRVLVIAPGLLFTFVALLVLSRAEGTTTLLIVAVLYAIGIGAAQPTLMAMTVDRARPQERGAAMGTSPPPWTWGSASGRSCGA